MNKPVEVALKTIYLEVEATFANMRFSTKLPKHSIGSVRRVLTDLANRVWSQGYAAACDRYGIELGTYGDKIPQSPYCVPAESKNDESEVQLHD